MARPMREGTCRVTKTGQKYCKKHGKVKFVKKGGRSRTLSGSRKKRGTKGKKCIRRQRVRARSGGTVLRCKKYK